jgi:hypothetical protein
MAHKLVAKHNRQQKMKWERTLGMRMTKLVLIKQPMNHLLGEVPILLQAEVV